MSCCKNMFRCCWIAIVVFAVLYLLTLYAKWHAIEQDVATNAASVLQASSIDWANVDTFNRGRDVLLTGVAPNIRAVEQAKDIVLTAEGVRVVDYAGDLVEQQLPSVALRDVVLTIRFQDNKVVLDGIVANQAEVNHLLAQATGLYGVGNVVNKLRVEDGFKSFVTNGLFAALADLSDGDAVEFQGLNIRLIGDVDSFGIKSMIKKRLAGLFPAANINNQLAIIVQEVLPEQMVDKSACHALFIELLEKSKIYFETAQAVINADSYALLDKLAFSVRRCPEALVEVSGHTDADGEDAANLQLSQKRAAAVVNYLINSGVQLQQLTAIGYGETQAVADNETAAGKAQNRRIEFTVKN